MEEEERIKLVEAAAAQAQLMHTVNSMPNGLNTMIGDRSEENLSDGQTQRLSLARGFLKDSEMMMLDEPTSALDPVVEQRIVDAIRQRLARGGRTRTGIIVAHRISTIMSCDTILFLERVRTPSYFWLRLRPPGSGSGSSSGSGSALSLRTSLQQSDFVVQGPDDEGAMLAESGNHSELMARDGQYAAFVKQLHRQVRLAHLALSVKLEADWLSVARRRERRRRSRRAPRSIRRKTLMATACRRSSSSSRSSCSVPMPSAAQRRRGRGPGRRCRASCWRR